jgi:hypothetical protein
MEECALQLLKTIPCTEIDALSIALYECGMSSDVSMENIMSYIDAFKCVGHTLDIVCSLMCMVHLVLIFFIICGVTYLKLNPIPTKPEPECYHKI